MMNFDTFEDTWCILKDFYLVLTLQSVGFGVEGKGIFGKVVHLVAVGS